MNLPEVTTEYVAILLLHVSIVLMDVPTHWLARGLSKGASEEHLDPRGLDLLAGSCTHCTLPVAQHFYTRKLKPEARHSSVDVLKVHSVCPDHRKKQEQKSEVPHSDRRNLHCLLPKTQRPH